MVLISPCFIGGKTAELRHHLHVQNTTHYPSGDTIMALFVDLTQAPYAVLADTASAAAANSAAIQTAISDHSGMNARLVLPAGKIYLDRQGASPAYCIKFGAGVTDLTLAGAGQYATLLI